MPNALALVRFRVFPALMGGQKGVVSFYKYLSHRINITLAVSVDNDLSPELDMKKILQPNKWIFLNIFKLRKLASLVKARDIEVIIAEHSYPGWIAWLLHKTTGKPFIIHSHNIEARRFHKMNKWWWRWYLWYEGWIHRKAQYSFFISEEDKKTAISQFRLNPDQCLVITYGIDRAENNILTKQESRRRLGIDPQKAVFLFNGTLDYKPNHDAIINFIEEINPSLQKKLTNYEIIITGNRISKELIQNLKSKKNLTYRGYVDNIDIYYQAADLFLNPITNDTGVKTKVIESIANNCTVISTESGASGIM